MKKKSLVRRPKSNLKQKLLLPSIIVVATTIIFSTYFIMKTTPSINQLASRDDWRNDTQINIKVDPKTGKADVVITKDPKTGKQTATVKYTETDPKTKVSVDKTIVTSTTSTGSSSKGGKVSVVETVVKDSKGNILVDRRTDEKNSNGVTTGFTTDKRTDTEGKTTTYTNNFTNKDTSALKPGEKLINTSTTSIIDSDGKATVIAENGKYTDPKYDPQTNNKSTPTTPAITTTGDYPPPNCNEGMCKTTGSPVCSGAYVFTGGNASASNLSDGTYGCAKCGSNGGYTPAGNCSTLISAGAPVVLMYDANSSWLPASVSGGKPCFKQVGGSWVQSGINEQKEDGTYCGADGKWTDKIPVRPPAGSGEPDLPVVQTKTTTTVITPTTSPLATIVSTGVGSGIGCGIGSATLGAVTAFTGAGVGCAIGSGVGSILGGYVANSIIGNTATQPAPATSPSNPNIPNVPAQPTTPAIEPYTGFKISIAGADLGLSTRSDSVLPLISVGTPHLPTSIGGGAVNGALIGGGACAATIVGIGISPGCAILGAIIGGTTGWLNSDNVSTTPSEVPLTPPGETIPDEQTYLNTPSDTGGGTGLNLSSLNQTGKQAGFLLDPNFRITMQTGSAVSSINLNTKNVSTPYDTSVYTSGCGPATLANYLRLTNRADGMTDAQLMNKILNEDKIYIACTENGCSTGADAILQRIEDVYRVKGAFQDMSKNKITSTSKLAGFTGTLIYQGEVDDPTVSYQNKLDHNTLISCDSGNCYAYDSYTSDDGKPKSCQAKNDTELKCGDSTYRLGFTPGKITSALYAVPDGN